MILRFKTKTHKQPETLCKKMIFLTFFMNFMLTYTSVLRLNKQNRII